jgi:hypothetical protein
MTRKEETRRYESVTLGLPPLKMIPVETDAESREKPTKKTAVSRETQKDSENLKAVIKLIDHLTGTDR